MTDDFRNGLRHDLNAGLADAEAQLEVLAKAGPGDVAMVLEVMERALDADADPRLIEGVAALRRILAWTENPEWTKADFAKAEPASELPEAVRAALPRTAND